MNISDEKLSAFLDGELPEADMAAIHAQLSVDEKLGARLAELAVVDHILAQTYAGIDAQPLPEAITKMLTAPTSTPASASASTTNTATVIAFPLWRRLHQGLHQHAGIAASVALVLGFALANLLPQNGASDADRWPAIAQVLERATSGHEQIFANAGRLTPRATFINREGDYCRVYRLIDNTSASENIACRRDQSWQLKATVILEQLPQAGSYQTASADSLLDSAVQQMAVGEFFAADAEARAIATQWAPSTLTGTTP